MHEHMGAGVQEGVQHSTWEYETMSVGCSKRGEHGCKKAQGSKVVRMHDTNPQGAGGDKEGGGKGNCQSVCQG